MTMELGIKPPGYERRHQRPNAVIVGVKTSLNTLVREHDLALAAVSGLAVIGTIFAVFSLAAYTFHFDHDLGFIFGMFSTASFIATAACWYFFLADQQPKHGKGR